jgi:hypothetical protein
MKHYEIATAIRADLLAGTATEEARAEYRYIRKTYAAERDALVTMHGKSYSPAETVAALVEAIGHENAAEIVALMVCVKGTWDERITSKVRAWAADLVTLTADEIRDALGLYYSDSIHPAHLDQIARAMMAYTPAETETTEAPAEPAEATGATETTDSTPDIESPAEAEEEPIKTLDRIRSTLEASPARSAWARGVKEYAAELLDGLEEATLGGWFDLDDLAAPKLVSRALLNGSSDWAQYSWGGCSLIYNEDIARRLCSPSELKRTRDGERRPNAREEWLDTQARALYQAAELLRGIIAQEVTAQ